MLDQQVKLRSAHQAFKFPRKILNPISVFAYRALSANQIFQGVFMKVDPFSSLQHVQKAKEDTSSPTGPRDMYNLDLRITDRVPNEILGMGMRTEGQSCWCSISTCDCSTVSTCK